MAHQRYFAPSFAVTINGVRLTQDVTSAITRVSVTHELNAMDSFSMTVVNPYPELPWLQPAHARQFREGNPIVIELGYVDDLRPLLEGEIHSLTLSFPSGGTPTIEVAGYNLLKRLGAGSKTRDFADRTDQQIAQAIAREAGLRAKADATALSYKTLQQTGQSDMDFLLERAERIGFELWVDGKELYFRRPATSKSSRYTLVWGAPKQDMDLGGRAMPLLNLELALNTANQVSKVVVAYGSQANQAYGTVEAGDGDADRGLGGAESGARALGKEVIREVYIPVESEQEAKEYARALFNRIARGFVTGSGATVGLPDLRAGMVIALEGLGPRYSGRYYVTRTTHTLDDGGYQTSLSFERGAVG
jgi:uncharacterized protein